MACSCKSGSPKKQVTSVKQVVKTSKPIMSSTRPQKKNVVKRTIKRAM